MQSQQPGEAAGDRSTCMDGHARSICWPCVRGMARGDCRALGGGSHGASTGGPRALPLPTPPALRFAAEAHGTSKGKAATTTTSGGGGSSGSDKRKRGVGGASSKQKRDPEAAKRPSAAAAKPVDEAASGGVLGASSACLKRKADGDDTEAGSQGGRAGATKRGRKGSAGEAAAGGQEGPQQPPGATRLTGVPPSTEVGGEGLGAHAHRDQAR